MLTFSRQLLKSPIGRKLMLSIVLFSSLITLLTTIYQLFNDYNSDVSRIDRAFESVEKVNLDVLAASIWVIDERLINTQLNGLSQLPDFTYISIKDDSGQEWQSGNFKQKGVIEQEFPLIYRNNDEIQVGTLLVQADLNNVYDRLYDKAIVILLSNAIKTFLVAGFILFLVWLNITKHLHRLSEYCAQISLDKPLEPLSFLRKPADDEFAQVADAINTMQQQVRASFAAVQESKEELQEALEDRERLLELERSYKDELARQVKEQTKELEQSLLILKRAQQVLVEQEKMAALGGLVSGVAHEINTPIGICLTAASSQLAHVDELIKLIHSDHATLEEINSILEEYQQSCQLIVNNITRASSLIQKFKTVAAEQSNEKNTEFNLKQQLTDIAESTQIMFSPQDVEIGINANQDLWVSSNQSLLNQIFSNILSNAFTHAFIGVEISKILINVVQDGDTIKVEIQNNGLPIPEDVAEHMFEPFFTTTRNKGGTGLGLSAAFNAATLLKGTIQYEAESSLGGPMFIVCFPKGMGDNEDNQLVNVDGDTGNFESFE
ncbi:histidine kinase [Shewanella sp. WXL01]|uniref:sensor histidine kinase n=1 Tax=Shewanella sp. WXL01 TaxID=2709721 RepID=UPI0014384822|nr:ATP-binding protein [Shewanella sp. WXL01]NKF49420.1 histidine kinase [Shewanella sp. WXL01]